MKSNVRIKITILFTFGIFLGLSPLFNNTLYFNAGYGEENSENGDAINLDDNNLKTSKASGKIHIIGNSGWVDFRNDGNCTGSGTYSDPYVIEDLLIDGGASGTCILIENSNVYFRIENCTAYNSGSGYSNAGILLSHVNNSQLIDNNCSSNDYGIYLEYSNNNTISGNTASYNQFMGISLWDSDGNDISGNTANDNGDGISLGGSNYNTVSENTANNIMDGISLWDSNDNTISENTASFNENGMHLYESNNNNISGNTASNNEGGIYLRYSDTNDISGNNASHNVYGINFDDECNYNMVSRNTVNYNSIFGISLYSSNNNEISGNNVNYNDIAISLQSYSNDNTLYFNNWVDNTEDVFEYLSINAWYSREKITYVYKDKTYTNYLGNYWSDYNGSDVDNDGIGDTPFVPPIIDNYPLMEPIDNYEIIEVSKDSKEIIPGYDPFVLLGILSAVTILMRKKLKKTLK